jgi:thiamine-phosphate pyrophosphorylase
MTASTLGRLHVITDETRQHRFSHVELAHGAAAGRADVVQYREKRQRTTREFIEMAHAMAAALDGTAARLLVDDRADVALAVGAIGVHLGRHDVDVATARRILGPGRLIGGTANSVEEALRVAATDVDYLGVGPVFGTTSKATPAPMLGLEGLAAIVAAVKVPVIAIGSMTVDRVADVLATGAHGLAVLSAIVCHPQPELATARFRQTIDTCLKETIHA